MEHIVEAIFLFMIASFFLAIRVFLNLTCGVFFAPSLIRQIKYLQEHNMSIAKAHSVWQHFRPYLLHTNNELKMLYFYWWVSTLVAPSVLLLHYYWAICKARTCQCWPVPWSYSGGTLEVVCLQPWTQKFWGLWGTHHDIMIFGGIDRMKMSIFSTTRLFMHTYDKIHTLLCDTFMFYVRWAHQYA